MYGKRWSLLAVLLVLVLASCGQIPTAVPPAVQGGQPSKEVAYPAPIASPTPPPTQEPLPTSAPLLEIQPTPDVTLVPVANFPYISEMGPAKPFQILFQRDDALWVIDSQGTPAQRVLDVRESLAKSFGMWPSWSSVSVSPDGQRLAMVLVDPAAETNESESSSALYLYDRRTEAATLLVEGAVDPQWSPDGNQIAYQKDYALWVMNLTTGDTRMVFRKEGEEAGKGALLCCSSWSPDGKWLAFLHFPTSWEGANEVLIASAEGNGKVTQLLEKNAYMLGPVWYPDSSRFLYVTESLDWTICSGAVGCDSLWLANPDGSGRSQLLPPTLSLGSMPVWSPDGQWIAFGGVSYFERELPVHSIWLMKADGTNLLRLTDPYPEGNDLCPSWTPDGTRIIFQRENQGIWMLDLANGGLRQLYSEKVDYLAVR